MSNLFKQISEQAAQQRAQIAQSPSSPTLDDGQPVQENPATIGSNSVSAKILETPNPPIKRTPKKVVPQSGATAPQKTDNKASIDMEKLRIIIEEISQMPTNNNGLNVRMSEQEMQDIEDFVLITLRKQGLRGYDVSIAKLMRYALRYMFRVHEKEFISALKQSLKAEDTLSI